MDRGRDEGVVLQGKECSAERFGLKRMKTKQMNRKENSINKIAERK